MTLSMMFSIMAIDDFSSASVPHAQVVGSWIMICEFSGISMVSQAISGSVAAEAATPSTRPLSSRSEEHTSELQSLMRISYAVFCLKKKRHTTTTNKQDITSYATRTHFCEIE